MPLDVDVLGPVVDHWAVGDGDGALIIALDDGGGSLGGAHVSKELPEVDGLLAGRRQGHVFCLATAECNT